VQLNREELLRAYRSMATIRRFEERVQEEFSKGGIPGFVHLYAGQEASAVGVCQHLGPKDYIASTHRGHGHSIAKGCDVAGMMQELFGKEGGLCGGKGGSMHIADLDVGMLGANGIVGGGPPLVVGAALTAKTLGTGKVAVCFSGDGASVGATTGGWSAPGSARRSSCVARTACSATPRSGNRAVPRPGTVLGSATSAE